MYKLIIFWGFIFSFNTTSAQKGMFSGGHNKWVMKEVEKSKEQELFKGYTFGAFHLLQEDEELEYHLTVYKKGTTYVILLIAQVKDALSYTIHDVVEIKNVQEKDNIQTGSCSMNKDHNVKIFVLEKNVNGKQRNIKAWYTDTDRLKFITIPVKGINCMVEGL